jgi:hypothetical protein
MEVGITILCHEFGIMIEYIVLLTYEIQGSQTQDELFVRFMSMTFKLYLLIPKEVNVNSHKIESSVK